MNVEAEQRFIGFRLGQAGVALPLEVVRLVAEHPRIVRVPGSHPFVKGVVLRDGVAVPAYDLRRFDPLWRTPVSRAPGGIEEAGDQLIVCEWGEAAVGLLGSRVDLMRGPGSDAGEGKVDETCAMNAQYVTRVLRVSGETIALLDADRLFASMGVPAAEPRGRRQAGEDDSAGG